MCARLIQETDHCGSEEFSMARRKCIEVREEKGVAIVTFVDKKILDEQNIRCIGEDLHSLVDKQGKKNIILDFVIIDYFPSAAFGTLIILQKKVAAAGGKLVLCNVSNTGQDGGIDAAFQITHLWRIFAGYLVNDWRHPAPEENLQKALEVFAS